MRVVVLGGQGQLGHALQATVPSGWDVAAFDIDDFDVADPIAVDRAMDECHPDLVVNAAAYTAVDRAESEQEQARLVNVVGARNAASAAQRKGAALIYVSTDFVFDGHSDVPYQPHDATEPLSVYGRTKRDGEIESLRSNDGATAVLRTAWLYGDVGQNFLLTMLRVMRDRSALSVVDDQVGTPTWTHSLARAIWAFGAQPGAAGTFHWTDGGQTSWFGFAWAIMEEALQIGLLENELELSAIPATEYPTPARRPAFSVLDTGKTTETVGLEPVPWRDNLRETLMMIKARDV